MSTSKQALLEASKILSAHSVYVVGGAVRDRLLNRPFFDYDLVFSEKPDTYGQELAQVLGGSAFVLDPERGVVRVSVSSELQIDLARFQGGGFEKDLDRRDFSINSLAVPLSNWFKTKWKESIIDRHGGLKAIHARQIKAVSKNIFVEDPLRLLRAFRLSAELGFQLSNDLLREIAKHKKGLSRSAPERVREELLKIFATDRAHSTFCAMEKTGLLDIVFPAASPLRKTAPGYYGKGGVLKHTLDSIKFFEKISAQLKSWFPRNARKIQDYLKEPLAGYPRSAHLKWALLLHDIGKPDTAKVIDGRLRFFEHEHVGADKVGRLAKVYRWSEEEARRYSALVRNHMRPGNLATHPEITDKAIHRFFRDLGPEAIGMLLVSLGDHLTYLTPSQLKKRNSPHELTTLKMISRYYSKREKILPPKLLTGHDIMAAFKIPPSPLIGSLMKDLTEAQCEQNIGSKEEAINYLKERLQWHQSHSVPEPKNT